MHQKNIKKICYYSKISIKTINNDFFEGTASVAGDIRLRDRRPGRGPAGLHGGRLEVLYWATATQSPPKQRKSGGGGGGGGERGRNKEGRG